MRNFWSFSLSCSLLASVALGQSFPVGTQDVSWANNSGQGSAALDARVHYPAIVEGVNTPLLPTTEGFPVVVFLHGWGLLGNDYVELGNFLAREGYVAVMLNTAQFSYQDMEFDARATFGAIRAADSQVGGFFEGALRSDRVGLLGHSMGAAVMAYVLNDDPGQTVANPGYLCGLGVAPVDPALAFAGAVVNVPIGLVSGLSDTLTPPAQHAEPYYNSLQTTEGLKFHYQMGLAADHMNLAGLEPQFPAVFRRTSLIVDGFFGQFLADDLLGLESVLGPDGVGDANLVDLDMAAAVPQSWAESGLRVGSVTRISVAAEDGYAGLLAAGSTASPTQTMLGELLLDPSTTFTVAEDYMVGGRLDILLMVPNSPLLIGTTFAVQGAGATIVEPFKLGSALSFEIRP